MVPERRLANSSPLPAASGQFSSPSSLAITITLIIALSSSDSSSAEQDQGLQFSAVPGAAPQFSLPAPTPSWRMKFKLLSRSPKALHRPLIYFFNPVSCQLLPTLGQGHKSLQRASHTYLQRPWCLCLCSCLCWECHPALAFLSSGTE